MANPLGKIEKRKYSVLETLRKISIVYFSFSICIRALKEIFRKSLCLNYVYILFYNLFDFKEGHVLTVQVSPILFVRLIPR